MRQLPLRLRLWRQSQTLLWAKLQLVLAGAWEGILQMGGALNDPTVKEYLDMIDVPKSVIIAIAFFGLITYLVHGHSEDA